MDYDPTEVAERPWGAWKVVHQEGEHIADQRTVKVLTVNPGCMLSLQTHKHRSEFWVPLSYGLVAYVYEQSNVSPELAMGESRRAELLKAFRVFEVRNKMVHRLMNPGINPVSVVEIIQGQYDEDDIERLQDAYGRK